MEIDNITILRLEVGTIEDIKSILNEITEKNSQRQTFAELNQDNKKKKLWNILFNHLDKKSSNACHIECLVAVRMLSRDKTDLDQLVNEKCVELLLSHAGLSPQEHNQQHLAWHNLTDEQYQIMIESLKALCNLIFNSEKVQAICKENNCIEEIVTRLRLFKEPDLPYEIKYFDMRLLFLITALCPEITNRLKDELHGLTYLMEALDLVMNEAAVGRSTIKLSSKQVTLASEVLKVLFNLMAKTCTPHFDEEEDAHFLRLEMILKNLLLCRTEVKEDIDTLRNHIVNLLTAIPGSCHKELISTVSSDDPLRGAEFDGKNMEAVAILVDFLDKRLNGLSAPEGTKSQLDLLSPILTVLIECARSDSVLRRYIRLHVLPPLRDVKKRPEEGDKLRNKLCRLLTSTITNVRDLVAELLFVLCKENVARMIKYTGYGNAAGMFASRGLLGRTRHNSGDFSSNSEDSDTEEYAQYRDRINPVVGCYEPPRPDPMASMTEEQKEYEAVKLANLMSKLSREGLIQPCRIGEDGRPHPVDHMLQLQDDLPRQQLRSDHHSEEDD